MTESVSKAAVKAALEARLAKRYRSEARFRGMGLAAIFTAVAILVILLGSIGMQSLPAYTANEIFLEVDLDADLVDPQGDGSEVSLREGSYTRVLQNAMREQFPEVRARRDLRQLFQLYTALNAPRLMDLVLDDPSLVGTRYRFRMPLSDDMDLYLKGELLDQSETRLESRLQVADDGGDFALISDDAGFAAVLEDQRTALRNEAVALGASADANEQRARDSDGEDVSGLEDRIANLRRRQQGLLDRAEAADGVFRLDDTLPSVIVEMAGGAYKLDGLSLDGTRATGRVVVQPETEAADSWNLLVVDVPESRRRSSDNQLVWSRTLRDRGVIEEHTNRYFFGNADSREPELAGVRGALHGSILTIIIALILSVPVGVFAAIYLEEFAPKNPITDIIEVNINNLAAVPSIVFGMLGLAVFINVFGLPRSSPVLGGLVLSLMTLPTIIIATRAALKAVPPSIRQAALGIGASETQTVFHHVLPLAAPGILTGSIIGLSRALGETAPLLMIGMVAFIAETTSLDIEGMTQPATVLPVQVFLWYDGAERAFEPRAAAAIMVLLGLMISFNALAIYLRHKFERRW